MEQKAENACIIKSQSQKTLNDLVKDLPSKAEEVHDVVKQLAVAQEKISLLV